jgi:hypothetical protein
MVNDAGGVRAVVNSGEKSASWRQTNKVSGGGNEGGGYGVFIGEVSWQNTIKIGQILWSPDPFEYGIREQILSLEVEDNLTSGSQPSEKKGKGGGKGSAVAAGPRGGAGGKNHHAGVRGDGPRVADWLGWTSPFGPIGVIPLFSLVFVFFFLR